MEINEVSKLVDKLGEALAIESIAKTKLTRDYQEFVKQIQRYLTISNKVSLDIKINDSLKLHVTRDSSQVQCGNFTREKFNALIEEFSEIVNSEITLSNTYSKLY